MPDHSLYELASDRTKTWKTIRITNSISFILQIVPARFTHDIVIHSSGDCLSLFINPFLIYIFLIYTEFWFVIVCKNFLSYYYLKFQPVRITCHIIFISWDFLVNSKLIDMHMSVLLRTLNQKQNMNNQKEKQTNKQT